MADFKTNIEIFNKISEAIYAVTTGNTAFLNRHKDDYNYLNENVKEEIKNSYDEEESTTIDDHADIIHIRKFEDGTKSAFGKHIYIDLIISDTCTVAYDFTRYKNEKRMFDDDPYRIVIFVPRILCKKIVTEEEKVDQIRAARKLFAYILFELNDRDRTNNSFLVLADIFTGLIFNINHYSCFSEQILPQPKPIENYSLGEFDFQNFFSNIDQNSDYIRFLTDDTNLLSIRKRFEVLISMLPLRSRNMVRQ